MPRRKLGLEWTPERVAQLVDDWRLVPVVAEQLGVSRERIAQLYQQARGRRPQYVLGNAMRSAPCPTCIGLEPWGRGGYRKYCAKHLTQGARRSRRSRARRAARRGEPIPGELAAGLR